VEWIENILPPPFADNFDIYYSPPVAWS